MLKKDEFLSDILSINCASVSLKEIKSVDEINKFKFIYAKTDDDVELSIKATRLGFYLADISVKFSLMVSEKQSLKPVVDKIEIAKEKYLEQLQDIAYHSFIFDRFHNDPNISNEKASEIKKNWISNYFKGPRGDKCFVYIENNVVKGFLLSLKNKELAVIDLIAVKREFRGCGVSKDLIRFMLNYYRNSVKKIEVGTQLKNSNSIRLYQSLGFGLVEYNLTWHYYS